MKREYYIVVWDIHDLNMYMFDLLRFGWYNHIPIAPPNLKGPVDSI